MTDPEYGALRSELNFWQNVRLTIVGFDFAVLGGALASDGLTRNPWVAVVFVVAVLIGSALFVWFAVRSSLCIGAYVQVFYEEASGQPGWETRMRRWSFTPFTLFRHILVGIFLLLLVLTHIPVARTLLTPPPAADPPAPPTPWFDPLWGSAAVALTVLLLVTLATFLIVSTGYRRAYVARWQRIRAEEQVAGGGKGG